MREVGRKVWEDRVLRITFQPPRSLLSRVLASRLAQAQALGVRRLCHSKDRETSADGAGAHILGRLFLAAYGRQDSAGSRS